LSAFVKATLALATAVFRSLESFFQFLSILTTESSQSLVSSSGPDSGPGSWPLITACLQEIESVDSGKVFVCRKKDRVSESFLFGFW
jgi:hypothetical protein